MVQILDGDAPFIGFVFVCETDGAEPTAQKSEAKDPKWIPVPELKIMAKETPEKFFIIHLGSLKEYLEL